MNKKEFLSKIVFSGDEQIAYKQRKELIAWLDYFGILKYQDVYEAVLVYYQDEVTYERLTGFAKYNANLSTLFFSMLRIIEDYLKATISNRYGEIYMKGETKENYNGRIYYDCFLLYVDSHQIKPYELDAFFTEKDGMTLYEWLCEVSISKAVQLFMQLRKKWKDKYPFYTTSNEELLDIVELRNFVCHHRLIVEQNRNDILNRVIILLRNLPREQRHRYINRVNSLKFYKDDEGITRDIGDYAIQIDEKLSNDIVNF
jgi:hypothetical protein